MTEQLRRGTIGTLSSAIPGLGRDAKKELGLGQPPSAFGDCQQALADQCSPQTAITIAEVASWRTDLPVADSAIGTTYGDRLNVWGTTDNQPPAGVTSSTNTLGTPGLFASDMIMRGIRVRLLVEPEARTIMGNFVEVTNPANLPISSDAWTINDMNNALGLVGQGTEGGVTQSILPAEFLWGLPTWKAAYNFMQGYELAVTRSHQDAIIREPLTQVGTIEPFAEAEAAGLAFASNQDRVLVLNDRIGTLGATSVFVPEYYKRLGALTVGGADVGAFTVSREADASSAVFGGIGVPTPWARTREPFLFNQPIFWPAGFPITIQFQVHNANYQADFQRWLSLTGGAGGQPGRDLNLPFSSIAGMSGVMPTLSTSPTGLEQTLDVPTPVNVPQSTQTNRALLKGGTMLFEIGVIGWRISNPAWGPVVAQAIKSNAIVAPNGYGSLTSYMGVGG